MADESGKKCVSIGFFVRSTGCKMLIFLSSERAPSPSSEKKDLDKPSSQILSKAVGSPAPGSGPSPTSFQSFRYSSLIGGVRW